MKYPIGFVNIPTSAVSGLVSGLVSDPVQAALREFLVTFVTPDLFPLHSYCPICQDRSLSQ